MKTLFKALPFLLAIYACNSSEAVKTDGEQNSNTIMDVPTVKTEKELKQSLGDMELSKPLKYLSLQDIIVAYDKKQTRHSTWFRSAKYEPDGILVTGSVVNTATVANFKDLTLKIRFYSSTNSLIEEQSKILYDYAPASRRIHFSLKFYPPEGTSQQDVVIADAVPIKGKYEPISTETVDSTGLY